MVLVVGGVMDEAVIVVLNGVRLSWRGVVREVVGDI